MVRWLLVGLLLAGFGIGLQRRWVVLDFRQFVTDLNVPFLADPEPTRRFQFKRGNF